MRLRGRELNKLHGNLFEYLRNSALDAKETTLIPATNRIPPFKRNQFGNTGRDDSAR